MLEAIITVLRIENNLQGEQGDKLHSTAMDEFVQTFIKSLK